MVQFCMNIGLTCKQESKLGNTSYNWDREELERYIHNMNPAVDRLSVNESAVTDTAKITYHAVVNFLTEAFDLPSKIS